MLFRSGPYSLGEEDRQGNAIKEPQYRNVFGYLLIWPLAAVARCKFSTDEQAWRASEMLQRIGERLGLNLAFWARDQGESPLPLIFR